MKALILNSGVGKRMGSYTRNCPKCMVSLADNMTLISRQLKILYDNGIQDVIITIGPFAKELKAYVEEIKKNIRITFVENPLYENTNYIYSIFLAKEYLHDDLILLHGDLVFSERVFQKMMAFPQSCMAVSSCVKLPEKDFKAVISKNRIKAVGISYMENVMAAQPFYVLKMADWEIWLDEIEHFCMRGQTDCYAEDALNLVTSRMELFAVDYREQLCQEVDTEEDLKNVQEKLKAEVC